MERVCFLLKVRTDRLEEYRERHQEVWPEMRAALSATGAPLVSGRATAEPGLFFCGAIPSALGQLRQIGIEATRIAAAAA